LWVVKESDGYCELLHAYSSEKQADLEARYTFSHLTREERKSTTISVESYVVNDSNRQKANDLFVHLRMEGDSSAYSPVTQRVIKSAYK